MNRFLDVKGLGFGLATFFIGYAALAAMGVGSVAVANTPIGKPVALLFQGLGQLLPLVSGYMAAYHARLRPFTTGTIGGVLGMAFLLAPVLFIPQYPATGGASILVASVMLASLGAIVGTHRRKKHGP